MANHKVKQLAVGIKSEDISSQQDKTLEDNVGSTEQQKLKLKDLDQSPIDPNLESTDHHKKTAAGTTPEDVSIFSGNKILIYEDTPDIKDFDPIPESTIRPMNETNDKIKI